MLFFWVSKGIREFAEAMIANPHDWVQTDYYFVNKKHRDLQIWTANGVWFISINGNCGLSLAEKFYLLSAIKLTSARKLATPEVKEQP